MASGPHKAKKAPEPRPSSSVVLISPRNEILLLHRVKTSTAFPSAHVFPGGNLSAQDGNVPPPSSPQGRHRDSLAYRHGAIRETFEESGIVLARPAPSTDVDEQSHEQRRFRTTKTAEGGLLHVKDDDRERGRRAIHDNKLKFRTWVDRQGGVPDIDGLIPFTRWVTPTNVPKRYTTQMYLYFLPLSAQEAAAANPTEAGTLPSGSEFVIPTPTSDGGIEHTAAKFRPAREWISMAQSGEIILFPPQFLLLALVGQFLNPEAKRYPTEELGAQRDALLRFADGGNPPWTEKCISPRGIMFRKGDGRAVLALDQPGPELEGLGRRGDDERVVLVKFSKEGPRQVEVMWKKDALEQQRAAEGVTEMSQRHHDDTINQGSGKAEKAKI